MMFLLRTAFWLAIVILLLPTDSQQQSEVYGTAQAAVKDMSGFCDRNPDACAKGKDAFAVFVQKAQFGYQMLLGFIEGQTAPEATSDAATVDMPAGSIARPASWDQGASQNTLTPSDLEPAWSGPAAEGA